MPPKVNHTSFGQEIVITKIDGNDIGRYECSATQPGLADPLRKEFVVRLECKYSLFKASNGGSFTITSDLKHVFLRDSGTFVGKVYCISSFNKH